MSSSVGSVAIANCHGPGVLDWSSLSRVSRLQTLTNPRSRLCDPPHHTRCYSHHSLPPVSQLYLVWRFSRCTPSEFVWLFGESSFSNPFSTDCVSYGQPLVLLSVRFCWSLLADFTGFGNPHNRY